MNRITRYIDCDGVILDTESGLFDEYNRLKKLGVNIKRLEYLQQFNWYEWIRQASIINDSITILKEHSPDSCTILTKIHSLSEGTAKIKYFREMKVKNNIILVPNNLNKSDVVSAGRNILVDDSVRNLEDWDSNGGISIFFNSDKENSEAKVKYPSVDSLDTIFSEEINDYCKKLLLRK